MKFTLTPRTSIAMIVSALVLLVLVAGLILAGSPHEQRSLRLDRERVSHLVEMAYSIDTYWNEYDALPETLEELASSRLTPNIMIRDPETNVPYGYRITSPSTYQLCTIFDRPSESDDANRYEPYRYEPYGSFWSHGPGQTCFSIDAAERTQDTVPSLKPVR